jgi:hypothetical protein
MRIAAEAGLLLAFTVVCLLYFDLFIRDGYTRGSLVQTQIEARDLARLLSHELTPGKMEMLAKAQNIPFKRLTVFVHRGIPPGCTAYRCGKLTFFFDGNDQLVDVRGHLLNHSLLNSD